MEKKLVALVFIALLGGLTGGYGLGHTIYETQFRSEISNLQSQLTALNMAYTELLSNYQQLETLVQPSPKFSIIDFSYEADKYTVYVTIQNIGDSDAHNVTIYSEVELYPIENPWTGETETPIWHGNTSIDFLLPFKAKNLPIKINQNWFTSAMRLQILYFNVTSIEGVTQGFSFEYYE